MTYVERLQFRILLPQDVPLEPPRYSFAGLVSNELLARYCEDVVKLLQGSLLGFRHEEEDHDECDDIEASVKSKGASRSECSENSREGDGED